MINEQNAVPRIFDFEVVLASASPRRRELMHMLVPDLVVAESRDVDETYPHDLPAEEVPEWISRIKADAYSDYVGSDRVLLTADTVVILDGRILGKPHYEAEACEMLRRLSGNTHTVVTGVCLTTPERRISFSEHTQVEFDPMTDAEIKAYVEAFRPLDKAGAYGIQ
ncbi:MAG: Maf family nucleotide pyrophosphatase, partial [Muribaculaceae bacterium]|nr:Maf family nucleotide pyrophosphatase [Muribaculaceae bacterium]